MYVHGFFYEPTYIAGGLHISVGSIHFPGQSQPIPNFAWGAHHGWSFLLHVSHIVRPRLLEGLADGANRANCNLAPSILFGGQWGCN